MLGNGLDFALLSDLFLKATGLLLVAFALSRTLRHSAAATQSWLLRLTVAGLLLMPVLSLALPSWEFDSVPLSAPELLQMERPAKIVRLARERFRRGIDAVASQGPGASSNAPTRQTTIPVAVSPAAVSSSIEAPWARLLVVGWMAGVLLLLFQVAVGVLRMRWTGARMSDVAPRSHRRLLSSVSRRLGIRRPPLLRHSESIKVPVIWGISKPTLLLPSQAKDWSPERLRMVFMHELAHLKRRDVVSLLGARLAAIFYWMNPLAWWLERRNRAASERACDDLVILAGAPPSEYARQLLAIAVTVSRPPADRTLTAAMAANPDGIEHRLEAVLGRSTPRKPAPRWALALMVLACCVVVIPVSTMQLTAQPTPGLLAHFLESSTIEEGTAVGSSWSTGRVALSGSAAAGSGSTASGGGVSGVSRGIGSGGQVVSVSAASSSGQMVGVSSGVGAGIGVGVAFSPEPQEPDRKRDRSREGERAWERAYDFHRSDRYEQAIAAFQESVDFGYREATAMYNVACGYSMLDEPDRAIDALDEAIDLGFSNWGLLWKDSDLDPLRSDPRFQELLDSVASNISDGRLEVALRRLALLRETDSLDGNRWASIGHDLLTLRQMDEGIGALTRAVDLLRYDASTPMYNLACAYALKGDSQSAISWLNESVNQGFSNLNKLANDPDLRSVRSMAEFKGIEQRAEELSLNQFRSENKRHRGNSGNWDEAVDYYSDYVRSHPETGRAWSNLGYSLLNSDRPREAVDAFERAVDLGYRTPGSMYNVACSHSRAGAVGTAFDWLQRAEEAGFDLRGYVHSDEDLDNLRGHAQFDEYVDRYESDHGERHSRREGRHQRDNN